MNKYRRVIISVIAGILILAMLGGLVVSAFADSSKEIKERISSLEKKKEQIASQQKELEQEIASTDLVITGEGRIDAQTVMGKAPIRIAQAAKKYGKPVIAIAGCLGDGAKECFAHGIDFMIAAVPGSKPDAASLEHDRATENIKRAAQEAIEQYLKQ